MLRQTEGRRREQQMRWLDGITDSVDMNLGKLGQTERARRPGELQATGSQRAGHGLVTGQQQQRVRQGPVAGKRGPRAHSQAISLRSLGRHSREVREENTLVRSHSEPNSSLKTQTRLWFRLQSLLGSRSPSAASHQILPPTFPSCLRKPEPGLLLTTQKTGGHKACSRQQPCLLGHFLSCARI